ncbi:Uncharacterised protein [Mycobacteroides abscessus subsp. abscessus]|nr:Uncharacterised protein [Mycobacteroides abscessus subsp. abscessus]
MRAVPSRTRRSVRPRGGVCQSSATVTRSKSTTSRVDSHSWTAEANRSKCDHQKCLRSRRWYPVAEATIPAAVTVRASSASSRPVEAVVACWAKWVREASTAETSASSSSGASGCGAAGSGAQASAAASRPARSSSQFRSRSVDRQSYSL